MSPSERFHVVDTSLSTLRDAGFDAVTYTDQLPGTSETFETTRVLTAGLLTIEDTWTC
jgi:hypothetical protein